MNSLVKSFAFAAAAVGLVAPVAWCGSSINHQLAGRWVSASCEPAGPGLYVKRDFTLTESTWKLVVTLYTDAPCSARFAGIDVDGPYEVKGPSTPVAGATEVDYKTAGHHVTARVGLGATGYYPLSQDLAYAPTILTPVTLKTRLVAGHRAAVVKLRVLSLGHQLALGKVTVVIGKQQVTARARGHQIILRLHGLATGRRAVRILYDGPAAYQTVKLRDHLRIAR